MSFVPPVVLPSLAQDFGSRFEGSRGLIYAYHGGKLVNLTTGAVLVVSDSEVLLTDDAVNYVQRNALGVVTVSTSAFDATLCPLAVIVTKNRKMITFQDMRGTIPLVPGGISGGDLPTPGSGDAGKVVTVKSDHTGYELDTPSEGGGGAWPPAAGFTAHVAPVTVTDDTDISLNFGSLTGVEGAFTLGDDGSGNMVVNCGVGTDGIYKVTATPAWTPPGAPVSDFYYEFYDNGPGRGYVFQDFAPSPPTMDPIVKYVSLVNGSIVIGDFQSTGNMAPGYSFGLMLVFERVARMPGPSGAGDGDILMKLGNSDITGNDGIEDESYVPRALAAAFPNASKVGQVWMAGGTSPSNGEWADLPVALPIHIASGTLSDLTNITDNGPHAIGCGDALGDLQAPSSGWSLSGGVLTLDHTTVPDDGTNGQGVYAIEMRIQVDDNGSGVPPTHVLVDPILGGDFSVGNVPRTLPLFYVAGSAQCVFTWMLDSGSLNGSDTTINPQATLGGGTAINVNVTPVRFEIVRISK